MNRTLLELLSSAEFYLRQGHLRQAIDCYYDAFRLDRRNEEVALTLSNLLFQARRFVDADSVLNKARKHHPNSIKISIQSGLIAHKLGQFTDAIKNFDSAIRFAEKSSGNEAIELKKIATLNKAVSLRYSGQVESAIELYIEIKRNFGISRELMLNLGNAYNMLKSFDNAIEAYRQGLNDFPKDLDLMHGLAEAYYNSGDIRSAKETFEQALVINPQSATHRFGLSMIQLASSEFKDGWKNYEFRWKDPIFLEQVHINLGKILPHFKMPSEKSDFAGKSVVVISEQGPGDTLMFLTMVPDLLKQASSVTFVIEDRLVKFVEKHFLNAKYITKENLNLEDLKKFDFVVPVGSLGQYFRTSGSEFYSNAKPNLDQSQNHIESYRSKNDNKFRVGISWRGGTVSTRQSHRSIDLKKLSTLLEIDNISFVSLQFDERDQDFEDITTNIERLPFELKADFEALGDFIRQLDFVITVQNTNAHLCGFLGKECAVLVPQFPEWRYGLTGARMPWYESLFLIRQDSDNWNSAIKLAKNLLIEKRDAYLLSKTN